MLLHETVEEDGTHVITASSSDRWARVKMRDDVRGGSYEAVLSDGRRIGGEVPRSFIARLAYVFVAGEVCDGR